MDETERRRPIALFMAFGTKGDVYPLAAIAAAFARDRKHYRVIMMSHLAHQNLSCHLTEANASYFPISSPAALAAQAEGTNDTAGSLKINCLAQKQMIKREHRRECYAAFERIFGHDPCLKGDFVVINFFALGLWSLMDEHAELCRKNHLYKNLIYNEHAELEGWSLAELFQIRCVVAAPYVVPYSAPSTFERQFSKELPELYRYLNEAPLNKVCWDDVIHWMWPLFTEEWGSWRSEELNQSSCPFIDPVTDLPIWHDRPPSPLLLYGFSREVVEDPDYWPSNVRVCGFWFLPDEWQFSCKTCGEYSSVASVHLATDRVERCSTHIGLHSFLQSRTPTPPIFIGLSSIGSMGFLRNPQAFLRILQTVTEITTYKFILFTAGYEPLDETVWRIATEPLLGQKPSQEAGISIFGGRLFCFSGMVPYNWLFQRCAAAIHHGGSGSTAAALHAGIPQIICPFVLDQFYWSEKMFWLGVAPEPLKRNHLVPDEAHDVNIMEAAAMLAKAIKDALSPTIKACALAIAERISHEYGVSEAVRVLTEEMDHPDRLN